MLPNNYCCGGIRKVEWNAFNYICLEEEEEGEGGGGGGEEEEDLTSGNTKGSLKYSSPLTATRSLPSTISPIFRRPLELSGCLR